VIAIKLRQTPTADQPVEDNALRYAGEVSEFVDRANLDKLAGIIERLLQKNFPAAPVANKLLLTLPEAQALTELH